jgi:RluA family pseudouridine synthase
MEDIPILFVDEQLLILNKPAGLRSIADGYDPKLPYLTRLLQPKYGRLWTVHRLDKDTSGVIIFTRAPAAHRYLSLQFEQRQVRKEYHALVNGHPDWQTWEVNLPLRINGDRRHRTVIDIQNGNPAVTSLKLLARFAPNLPVESSGTPASISLIAAYPHSGYTHQIRAHLAAIRLPIYADSLYKSLHPADRAAPIPHLPIQRTALHARQVTFTHPTTGLEISVEAPYPLDFQNTLAFLKDNEPGLK